MNERHLQIAPAFRRNKKYKKRLRLHDNNNRQNPNRFPTFFLSFISLSELPDFIVKRNYHKVMINSSWKKFEHNTQIPFQHTISNLSILMMNFLSNWQTQESVGQERNDCHNNSNDRTRNDGDVPKDAWNWRKDTNVSRMGSVWRRDANTHARENVDDSWELVWPT